MVDRKNNKPLTGFVQLGLDTSANMVTACNRRVPAHLQRKHAGDSAGKKICVTEHNMKKDETRYAVQECDATMMP
jgi:hypothetical protein